MIFKFVPSENLTFCCMCRQLLFFNLNVSLRFMSFIFISSLQATNDIISECLCFVAANSSAFASSFSYWFSGLILVSLGILVITCIQIHADETKSSLQFASRALRVTNCVHVNEVNRPTFSCASVIFSFQLH